MCLPSGAIRETVDEVISLLGIESLRIANPQLSGVVRNICSFAAAFGLDPAHISTDEVMSQFDYSGKKKVADALKNWQQGKPSSQWSMT